MSTPPEIEPGWHLLAGPYSVDDAADLAMLARARWQLEQGGGVAGKIVQQMKELWLLRAKAGLNPLTIEDCA